MTEYASVTGQMTAFARTFPCLRESPGTQLWDALVFDGWAAESPLSHGELVTAQFILAVWDPAGTWRCGRFDLMEALGVWDEPHRAAFLAWASEPWWP
jgi:hypothetical protein